MYNMKVRSTCTYKQVLVIITLTMVWLGVAQMYVGWTCQQSSSSLPTSLASITLQNTNIGNNNPKEKEASAPPLSEKQQTKPTLHVLHGVHLKANSNVDHNGKSPSKVFYRMLHWMRICTFTSLPINMQPKLYKHFMTKRRLFKDPNGAIPSRLQSTI